MRYLSVGFLKNDRLLFSAVQPVTVGGVPQHLRKQYVTDLDGKFFNSLLPGLADQPDDPILIATLPKDPRHVMVEDIRDNSGDVDLVDVYAMVPERIMAGSDRYGAYQTDLNGQLRAREYIDTDAGKVFIAQQYRDPTTNQWIELFRSYGKDHAVRSIVGFTSDPNVILIQANEGSDKTGVYEYDIKQKKIIEPAFQHKLFDVDGPVFSRAAADYGRLLGFRYEGADTQRVYWLDERIDGLQKSVEKALNVSTASVDWVDPGAGSKSTISTESGAAVELVSHSDDFKIDIFEKSGPKQPPEYYLFNAGHLALLGKARPWIDTSQLGDTKVVEYPARDGLMIPAFLTLPPASFGPGPYPTLIEPHGGPWARDFMDWDITGWTQYFASHGFAVLQPQFRGSTGWGAKLWRAGDAEWGQKMQDDDDDGVKWLVAQKIADPARVAMFGYSYGGYAALAAAIRPNGLYQCAISGAGAGNLEELVGDIYENRFGREYQLPTVKGLNPLAHAAEIKIPVLLYTGDHDVTVDPQQSRLFAMNAKASHQPVKLVEIKDMGHQYVFWTPDMAEEQLHLVDAFLKTDCKPGGL